MILQPISVNNSINFDWGIGTGYRGLAFVAQAQGKHQQAVIMFRKSLDAFTDVDTSWWTARVLAEMSWRILALGNEDEAGRTWRQSLRIAIDIHGIPVTLDALAGIASLKAKKGESEHALELLLMVLNNPAISQDTKKHANRLRADLETQFSQQQLEAIQMRADAKKLEDVVGDLLK